MADPDAPTIESSTAYPLRLAHVLGRGNFKIGHVTALLGWDATESVVRAFVGYRPGRVEDWDARTGVRQRSIEVCAGDPVSGVQIDPTLALLCSRNRRPEPDAGALWDLEAGVLLRTETRSGGYAAASQDGRLGVVCEFPRVSTRALAGDRAEVEVPGGYPVAASPDGSMFLTGPRNYDEGGLAIWRSDGTFVTNLKVDRRTPVRAAVFTADGRAVVFHGLGLECQEIATRQTRWRAHVHRARVVALQRSPDGETYFSLCLDSVLAATDAAGRPRWTVALRKPRKERGRIGGQLAVSPRGGWVAVVEDELRIFDARTGAERSSVDGHTGGVTAAAVSLDGRLVASGARDGEVRVYDAETGATLWTLEVDADGVVSIEFLPDRPALRTCGRDNVVRLWNLTTGFEEASNQYFGDVHQRVRVHGSLDGSRVLTWSRDELELASDRGPERVVWNVTVRAQYAETFTCEHSRLVACRWWVAEDESEGGFEMVDLDVTTGWQVGEGRRIRGRNFVLLQETEAGPIVVTRDGDWLVVREDWGDRRERQLPFPGDALVPANVAVSADGRWLVAGHRGTVEAWDLRSEAGPAARVDLRPLDQSVLSVAVSADGTTIAIGTFEGVVILVVGKR